jgi:2-polyprenyl-6-methoxyphenol hydroxylase-like FAD-dependent oxidoreductase
MNTLQTQCCIAGGGPAGMMLALLLVRAGVRVVVLEKHQDFLRDFRGDTVHPSTLQILQELGLLEEFLERPHQKVQQVRVEFEGESAILADLSLSRTAPRLSHSCPNGTFSISLRLFHGDIRIRFENAGRSRRSSQDKESHYRRSCKYTGGQLEIQADLVVAADGRQSLCDPKRICPCVIWERRWTSYGFASAGGRAMGNHSWQSLAGKDDRHAESRGLWQCAYLIRKGDFDQSGREAFLHFAATSLPLHHPLPTGCET